MYPKKSHFLLKNLNEKLGYDWVREATVTKPEDGKILISEGNNLIEMTLASDEKTVQFKDNSTTKTFYVIGKEEVHKSLGLRCKDVCLQEPELLPNKFLEGRLLKYINHKNKVIARRTVETVKVMLKGDANASVVVMDYTHMHTESDAGVTVPIVSLNQQITNMLRYDGIYRGTEKKGLGINWTKLKKLRCPHCHEELDERAENRLIIRDIMINNITDWDEIHTCQVKKINNPLIAVARNIVDGRIEELLKPATKKDTEGENNGEGEREEYEQ